MAEYLTQMPDEEGRPRKIQINGQNVFLLEPHERGGTTIVSPTGFRVYVVDGIATVRDHLNEMDGNYVFGGE
jgi:hypothetical protein